jgi:hypothetical protein
MESSSGGMANEHGDRYRSPMQTFEFATNPCIVIPADLVVFFRFRLDNDARIR